MPVLPRKLLAWLAIVFGGLGTVLCVAAVVFVWIGCFQFRGTISQVTGRFAEVTARLGSGAGQASARIETSRESFADLDRRIDERFAELAEGREFAPESFDELDLRLQVLSQRLDDWRTLAATIGELSDVIAEILAGVAIFFEADEKTIANLRVTLAEGEASVGEAADALGEIETQLGKVNAESARERVMEEFEPLFARIDNALVEAVTQTTAFGEGVAAVGGAVQDTAGKIRRLVTIAALAISFLLVWQAAAQFCLARWGWRIRAA